MAAAAGALRFSTFDVTKQVFFRSRLSLAIVNLKPIVDNHVLVIPRRLAPRMADLTSEEISDLFLSVQTIGRTIEKATNAKSLTIACQDGPFAGQSVPHVHIHILPRRPNDFEPVDAVYDQLDSVDITRDHKEVSTSSTCQGKHHSTQTEGRPKQGKQVKMDSERKPRSEQEMIAEATWLASLFPDNQ